MLQRGTRASDRKPDHNGGERIRHGNREVSETSPHQPNNQQAALANPFGKQASRQLQQRRV